jgi:hypothetical protein
MEPSYQLTSLLSNWESFGKPVCAHRPIDGEAGRKPAPWVINEWSPFVAQVSSLQPMQPEMAALRSNSPLFISRIGKMAPTCPQKTRLC